MHNEVVSGATQIPQLVLWIGAACFLFALIHIFSVGRIKHLAERYPTGSILENLFHFLSEVEVVFPIWAGIAVLFYSLLGGLEEARFYLESLSFNEPAFVFVIMAIAATAPIAIFAEKIIKFTARLIPIAPKLSFFFVLMAVGPILGSFITEPAAMTLLAGILVRRYFAKLPSTFFMYTVFAYLLVSVSIGGTLTNFAAPPVVMIAAPWGWDTAHMVASYGWKAAVVIVSCSAILTLVFRKTLLSLQSEDIEEPEEGSSEVKPQAPRWLQILHVVFLGVVVLNAHHPTLFIMAFVVFIALITVTKEFQENLQLKQSLLVAGFLGGLVILGGFQAWWLEPILTGVSERLLYPIVTVLTTITDNAALTYLSSLIEGLTDTAKYLIVAGAVAGGGVTLVANAPNPIANALLGMYFPDGTVQPLKLALYALPFTLLAFLAFWFLPNL